MNAISTRILLSAAVAVLFLFSSCDDDPFAGPDLSTVPDPLSIQGINPVTSESGLITYELDEGEGPLEVTIRDFVGYKYTLRLTNGRIVESSYSNGNTDPVFRNVRNHIEGFKEALLGMKEGGVKVIFVPPSIGYGNNENSDLRNDTLRFDLELTSIAY
ncbi:FKBP-type peptidyl-prolyl cis-trans isomerase [Balneola sp. MJW-20]|uniref:FKBP-type peptidyl-prolyl cis-trans isomerase n=1 Tax=Gracilimonas aurantiaca TaxID=3234185 RepID=UPI00346520D7